MAMRWGIGVKTLQTAGKGMKNAKKKSGGGKRATSKDFNNLRQDPLAKKKPATKAAKPKPKKKASGMKALTKSGG